MELSPQPALSQTLQREPRRNYLAPAREILKALRRAALFPTELRIALMILEWGLCRGRDAAVFRSHQDFADLDGEITRPQVTKAIGRLKSKNMVESAAGVYTFQPPGQWRVKGRAREGRQERQQQLELEFEKIAQQLDLNLYELDAELRKQFLAADGIAEIHGGIRKARPDGIAEIHGGVRKAHSGRPHNNFFKGDVQASKLKALRFAPGEEEFMDRVSAFLGPNVYENDGGKWRNRFRDGHRDKCIRVISAVELDRREQKQIGSPGGYMEDIWKRFAE